jgi:3-methylornithine--L-lysine ligase
MRLCVIGGKLQGTEAAYLALKAGYEVVLVDRSEVTPASGLAHETRVLDVTADERVTRDVLTSCDAVLPAFEDEEALAWLAERVPAWNVPFLFDLSSYHESCSKERSGRLFERLDLPRPSPWPACGFPMIVKPSGSSGSAGVRLVEDEDQLAAARGALEAEGHEVVVEEFAPGPSLSLEVIGDGGDVLPLQATLLEFDRYYDCKRVVAPIEEVDHAGLATADILAAFDRIGQALAGALRLHGVMDIEVMLHAGRLKLLEIDARLPSQTPTAVLHSCDVNMVQVLVDAAMNGRLPQVDRTARRASCYQHVGVADGAVEVLGEHMMGSARPLRLVPGLFGADEVLLDLPEGADPNGEWVATVITRGDTAAAARLKAAAAVDAIAAEAGAVVAPESSAMPGDECR